MKITTDIHIHTTLSKCGKPDAHARDYIIKCKAAGIKTLGFADHLWDPAVPGPSPWYAPQDIAHVLSIKELLATDEFLELTDGMKILVGCEIEYVGGGKPSLTRKNASLFDFVLVPPDHFHMKNFTIPAEVTEPEEIKKYIVDRFIETTQLGYSVPTSVAHPFQAMGFTPEMPELVRSLITDGEYAECFRAAAAAGVAVEINSCTVKSYAFGRPEDGISPEYIRAYTIAREAGCAFTIGSDAHSPAAIGADYSRYERFCEICGIEDIWFN